MIPYMQSKRTGSKDEDKEDVQDILDLSHIDKLAARVISGSPVS